VIRSRYGNHLFGSTYNTLFRAVDPKIEGSSPFGDSNKGVVNAQYKPYTELLEEMKRLDDNVYHLIDYFDGSN
jgi:hypothetical protein